MRFLDEAKIYACAGDGGAGSLSFRREKFIARGGPDGGDGAAGGDIIAECVAGLNTLIDYRYQQHFKAGNGKKGMGKKRSGARGSDKILALPIGTQIFDESGEILLGALTKIGERVPLLYGGAGGRGNASFRHAENQSPKYAQTGQKGQSGWLRLQLTLIAHAGLVGLPNAGKSSLLAALSAARPKIADYAFTTLQPHLGLVRVRDTSFVMADIPGLIEGAHLGIGLGQKFLRHIERCQILVHLIDSSQDNVIACWELIRKELTTYSEAFLQKKEMILLTKSDLCDQTSLAEKKRGLEVRTQAPVLIISSLARQGLEEVKQQILTYIAAPHIEAATIEQSAWHP